MGCPLAATIGQLNLSYRQYRQYRDKLAAQPLPTLMRRSRPRHASGFSTLRRRY
ncbi:hypothetical protein [Nocardia shimofusensis]|uniref:hypothetical protein n=1 Tax=Nocardia shimofusensis TaxID=228596 RepID=UPI000A4883D1|nr:hypothetical protein [Nocardia shimofusensis]